MRKKSKLNEVMINLEKSKNSNIPETDTLRDCHNQSHRLTTWNMV